MNDIYTKAGITDPNERKWFEEYKKSFDAEGHNNSLMSFIAGQYPNLVSKGGLKDDYYQMFGKTASQYAITPQKFAEIDDPLAKSNPKDWIPEQVDGRWYWVADVYNKKKKMWEKQQVRPMTGEEIKNKGMNGKTGDIDKLSGEQLGKLTFEELMSRYNPYDVMDNIDALSEDARTKFLAKYPNLAAELESKTSGTTGKRSGSRRRSGYKGKGKTGDTEKLEGIDKILGSINKVKEKNAGKDWGQWSKGDQLKVQFSSAPHLTS